MFTSRATSATVLFTIGFALLLDRPVSVLDVSLSIILASLLLLLPKPHVAVRAVARKTLTWDRAKRIC